MTAVASSSSFAQSPTDSPSHRTHWYEHPGLALRVKTTTSSPAEAKARQRILPTWPVPPGITIFIAGSWHSPTLLCVNHNGQQPSALRCEVPVGIKRLIRRSGFERAIRRRVLRAAVKLDALAVARVPDNSRAPKDT